MLTDYRMLLSNAKNIERSTLNEKDKNTNKLKPLNSSSGLCTSRSRDVF
jgi:hypothetical protein